MAEETRQRGPMRGFDLFKVGGIQIRIDYSWFIIFVLVLWSLSAGYFPQYYPDQSPALYWAAGFVATLLFFFSILAHEMSHSFMAIRAGIEIPAITLFIFGGMAHLSEDARDPKTEFKIAVVGPLMSFALAAVFWGVHLLFAGATPSLAAVVFEYLAWINLALGLFNLVPGFPLDGGRVFRAVYWWRTGSLERATRLAADIGKGFAITLMLLGGLQIFAGALVGGLWFLFIGMFLRGIAEGGYQELVMRLALEDVRTADVMVEEVVSVSPDLTVERLLTEYFLRHGYHGFPVVDDGKAVGIVSLSDIKQIPPEERSGKTVKEVMVPLNSHGRITADTPLSEALRKMASDGIGRLVVMEEGRMVGLLTKSGLMRFLEVKRVLQK